MTILTSVSGIYCKTSSIKLSGVTLIQHCKLLSTLPSALQSTSRALNVKTKEDSEVEQLEPSRVKWVELEMGPNITEEQKKAITKLPLKMTNRCKALMKQIICFPSEGGNLSLLLAAWVKVMKPQRADWLSILKVMKTSGNQLFPKVFECALLEDSFEANVRDYTNIISAYAKENRLQDAENAFSAMKRKGFFPDQVILTVLIHMYSKAGYFDRASEIFEEMKMLGLPLDKRAYGSMIMACIRAGMPEHGEMLLKEMDSVGVFAGKEVYKALLRAYSLCGKSDGAQRVFDAIQLAGIVPDAKVCALLINAYCVAGQSDDALSVLQNMRNAGIKPDGKCVALVLYAFRKEDNLEKAVALLIDFESDETIIGKEVSDMLSDWFYKLGMPGEVAESVLGDNSNISRNR